MCIGARFVATCGALERHSLPTAVTVPVTLRAGVQARTRGKDEGNARKGHECWMERVRQGYTQAHA